MKHAIPKASFTLSADQFALWSRDGERVIEPGEIELMVGSASDDIRGRASVTIDGEGRGSIAPAAIPARSKVK